MVYILLGTGFEEVEALAPCDLLRRAGIDTKLVGLNGGLITGGHGIRVQTDCALPDVRLEDMQMLVIPGGLGGVASVRACDEAMQLLRQAHQAGKYIAAICAAPTILAELGIADGHLCTCYPSMQDQMGSAILLQDAEAVQDGKLITGTSAGTAIAFALQLITALRGKEAAEEVAQGIVYRV